MKLSAELVVMYCVAIRLDEGEGVGDNLPLYKCCRENEYMDVVNETCVEEPEPPARHAKRFDPLLWMPEWLRAERNLTVHEFGAIDWLWYSKPAEKDVPWVVLHPEEQLVRRLLAVDADARRFVLEPFGDAVDPSEVADQKVCFDVTRDPQRPFVVATWLGRVRLSKCCADGARLNGSLQCEPPLPLQEVVVYQLPLNSNSTPWLPLHLRDSVAVADVYYDVLQRSPGIEGAVVDADDASAWRLLFKRPHEEWMNAVWVRAGGDVVGASTIFCFDATEVDSGLPARVLLARLEHVSKCCHRGQQLEAREMQCVPRPEMEVDERFTEMLAPNGTSTYWMPRALLAEGRTVPVVYRDDWRWWRLKLLFPADPAPVVGFPRRPPAASVRLRTASGREHTVYSSDFCFDALEGELGPRVLAVGQFDHITITTVNKCCYQGQMLYEDPSSSGVSPKTRCQQDASEKWTPENSSLADELYDDRLYVAKPLFICPDQEFTLKEEPIEHKIDMLLDVIYKGPFNVRVYCKDLLRRSDGGPAKDVLAFCEVPDAQLFVKVRRAETGASAARAGGAAAVGGGWRRLGPAHAAPHCARPRAGLPRRLPHGRQRPAGRLVLHARLAQVLRRLRVHHLLLPGGWRLLVERHLRQHGARLHASERGAVAGKRWRRAAAAVEVAGAAVRVGAPRSAHCFLHYHSPVEGRSREQWLRHAHLLRDEDLLCGGSSP